MAVPTLTANSPSAGDIAWTAFHIQYNGQSYPVNAGSTSDVYVYWLYNGGSPSATLSVSNTQPTLTADDLLLFINKNGIPVNVQFAQLVDGSLIVDGSILAANIAAGTIEGTNIAAGTIAGNNIAAGTITSSLIAANAITTGLLAAGAVGAAEIAAGTVVAGIVDSTTITGATIVADGSTGQILIYSGVPAAGNLIASISGAAGTDAHGNAFSQGVWSYNTNGAKLGMAPTGGQSQLHLVAASLAHSTEDSLVYAGANSPGAANESQYLIMTSGKSNGERDAGISLTSEPADASASENVLVSLGGQDALFIDRNNVQTFSGTPLKVYGESWHSVTSLSNGWTVSGTGFFRYKLMPDNTVMVQFAGLTPGTLTSGTVIFTFPSGYIPSFGSPMSFPIAPGYSAAPTTGQPEVVMRNSGAMQFYNLPSSTSNVAGTFTYPLD